MLIRRDLVPSSSVVTIISSLMDISFLCDLISIRNTLRNAFEPVPPISSVLDVPTVPKAQLTGALRSQNSQGGYGEELDNGDSTRNNQSSKVYEEEDFQD